jgi:hypothetical protein
MQSAARFGGREMAAILYLDDGRKFLTSNIAISGAYFLIAREVRNRPRLRLWLIDLSEQCAPFFDIDMRALAPEDRREFWAAAKRAFDAVAATAEPGFLDKPNSWVANCLNGLLLEKGKIDRGEPPPPGEHKADILPTDMDLDRWFDDRDVEEIFQQREAEYQRFRASRAERAADAE